MSEVIAILKKDIKNRKNSHEFNKVIVLLKDKAPSATSYICPFCGKKTTNPHGGICRGGICRFPPYKNKIHKFIKAGINLS